MEDLVSRFVRSRATWGAWLLVLVTGCATMAPGVPSKSGYRFTHQEASLLGVERPRLSLAMSGGGLRSSLYNYGVLKALYDDGLLQDVDVVSSVSGGSYLAYYLYTLQLNAPGRPFGAVAFGDTVFAERTCELIANANFVTYGNMAGALGKWPVYRNASFQWMYENQILTTYGKAPADTPVYLHTLESMVRDHRAPYLIVNATTYGKHLADVPWNARTFEFTPLAYGNFEQGFSPWRSASGEVREHPLLVATAASGAAQAPLRRTFEVAYGAQIELWDGGKSENLGAVAPLLRGTRRLVVVDAQYDGRGKELDAYHTLQRRMEDLGVGVSLDMRPDHRDTDVYPGRASGESLDTRLYYVKMDIPPTFRDHVYSPEGEARLRAAKAGDDAYWETLGKVQDRQWQCARLRDFRADSHEWMFFQAASYLRFAEREGLWPRVVRSDPPLIGDGVNHSFPRTTTFDQSFYLDQALAFIGLGYVTAKERVKGLMLADGYAPEAGDTVARP